MWLRDKPKEALKKEKKEEILFKKLGKEVNFTELEQAMELVKKFPVKKRRITREPVFYQIL